VIGTPQEIVQGDGLRVFNKSIGHNGPSPNRGLSALWGLLKTRSRTLVEVKDTKAKSIGIIISGSIEA
jgi:hypothetical protein